MNDLICYCFNFTASDIKSDLLQNRKSTILDKIKAEKRADTCDCAAKNPKGKGCLSDVLRVVNRIVQEEDMTPVIDILGSDTGQVDLSPPLVAHYERIAMEHGCRSGGILNQPLLQDFSSIS